MHDVEAPRQRREARQRAVRDRFEVLGTDRGLVAQVHAAELLGHHLAVVGAAKHRDVVAAFDQPRSEFFDVALDATPRGGQPALADHGYAHLASA